ncbi:unnamed protein product [Prunus armeniaca]
MSKLKKLDALDLSTNRLTGLIPGWLRTLPSLFFISLNNNSLSGELPKELFRLQALVSEKHATPTDHGDVELPIYTQRTNHSITALHIPDQISNLTNLERLDLSRNHLSGAIPSSLSNLHFLASFSVAYNNLHGPVPSGTQLQGFNATAFEGNPGLCGAPLPNECQQMNTSNNKTRNMEDVHDNWNRIPWLHISVTLGFIIGFWGVCGPLSLNRSWRYALL